MTHRIGLLSACLLALASFSTSSVAMQDLGSLLGQARTSRDQGQMAAAVVAYDAMLAQVPAHQTALLERAQALSWMGRYAEALAGYRHFRQRFPEHVYQADLRIAQVQAWSGDTSAALTTLAPWVEQDQANAVLDDATYRAWQGRPKDSIARLDRWLQSHPDDRAALLAKARYRSWMGRLQQARHDFEAVLVKYPDDGQARLGLAQLALWRGDVSEARRQREQIDQATRDSADGLLVEAQYQAAIGRSRASRTLLTRLAAGGPSRRDAMVLLDQRISADGPWLELRQSRTDSNEGLRSELPQLRAALPFLDGSVAFDLGHSLTRLQQQQRQSNVVNVALRQPIGSQWRLSAGLQQRADFGGDSASAWNAGAGWSVMPGLRLQLDVARSLLDFTPAAIDRRGSIRTMDLGSRWAPGDGLDTFNLAVGYGALSAGSQRRSLFASYDRRFPLSWLELHAGAVGRGFDYSETLPLGFFNPERYRYLGLTGSATLRRALRYELSLNVRGGSQWVNDDASQFSWGYGIHGEWLPGDGRWALFGAWNANDSGLPTLQQTDPSNYHDHTLTLGLRWRGLP